MITRIKNIKGDRFSIEFAKSEQDEGFYTVHGNKIVEGSNGRFISGPSFKGSDGWVNQTWMDKKFQDYVIGLVDEAARVAGVVTDSGGNNFNPDDDIPF
jgi:DNA-binding cell septation regulator SpoVG